MCITFLNPIFSCSFVHFQWSDFPPETNFTRVVHRERWTKGELAREACEGISKLLHVIHSLEFSGKALTKFLFLDRNVL